MIGRRFGAEEGGGEITSVFKDVKSTRSSARRTIVEGRGGWRDGGYGELERGEERECGLRSRD